MKEGGIHTVSRVGNSLAGITTNYGVKRRQQANRSGTGRGSHVDSGTARTGLLEQTTYIYVTDPTITVSLRPRIPKQIFWSRVRFERSSLIMPLFTTANWYPQGGGTDVRTKPTRGAEGQTEAKLF